MRKVILPMLLVFAVVALGAVAYAQLAVKVNGQQIGVAGAVNVASGVNWTFDGFTLNVNGVNWANVTNVNTNQINWNGFSGVNLANVNWVGANILAATGVNWENLRGANGNTSTSVNWQAFGV